MIYYFGKDEIIINSLSFLNTDIAPEYNVFSRKKYHFKKTNTENTIKSEIRYMENLWVENLAPNQITPFTFTVFSENDIRAVLLFDITTATKLWVNEKPVFFVNDGVCGFFCIKLNKGPNRFYGEFFSPRGKCFSFICRVSNYDTEMKRSYANILNSASGETASPCCFRALENDSFTETEKFEDCLFARDIFIIDTKKKIQLEVFPGNSNKKIDAKKIRYGHKYSLDLKKYHRFMAENTDEIILKYTFTKINGMPLTYYRMFVIKNFIPKAESLFSENKDRDPIMKKLYNSIETLKCNPQRFYPYYKHISGNEMWFDDIHGGEIPERNVRKIFFISKLDGKPYQYLIRKPKNFQQEKKYPLFLFISTGAASEYSFSIVSEDFFMADVSGRGVTGGSHIGEACILEILEHILQNNNIDICRIYLSGFSNGAYAALNLLQHFPDKFAGTLTLAGACNQNLLCNIENKRCLNIYSPYDKAQKNGCFPKGLQSNRLEDISCPVLTHRLLNLYIAQKTAISELLSYKTEKYPNSFRAKTYSLRHRKYYWFEFLDIAFGEKYAEVKAEKSFGQIKVNITNCNIFRLHIPPEMQKRVVAIAINGRSVCKISNRKTVIFIKTEDSYSPFTDKIDVPLLKGSGITDIYYEPLTVYTVGNSPETEKIAKRFAKPQTSGYDPRIYIEYPIREISAYSKTGNAIIVDDLSQNQNVKKIRGNLSVIPSDDGFEYKGLIYKGKYSLIQIASIFSQKILHIAANDFSMFEKNLFTRKVILSFDANGINPYLNSKAVVLFRGDYYRIYEDGGDLEKVINTVIKE